MAAPSTYIQAESDCGASGVRSSANGEDSGIMTPPTPRKRVAKQLVKTQFCKHLLRGYCRYGKKCGYAHETGELMPRPNLLKTKMCIKFLAGVCEGGTSCTYAHGVEELRADTSDKASSAQSAVTSRFTGTYSEVDAFSRKSSENPYGTNGSGLVSVRPMFLQVPNQQFDIDEDQSGVGANDYRFLQMPSTELHVHNSQLHALVANTQAAEADFKKLTPRTISTKGDSRGTSSSSQDLDDHLPPGLAGSLYDNSTLDSLPALEAGQHLQPVQQKHLQPALQLMSRQQRDLHRELRQDATEPRIQQMLSQAAQMQQHPQTHELHHYALQAGIHQHVLQQKQHQQMPGSAEPFQPSLPVQAQQQRQQLQLQHLVQERMQSREIQWQQQLQREQMQHLRQLQQLHEMPPQQPRAMQLIQQPLKAPDAEPTGNPAWNRTATNGVAAGPAPKDARQNLDLASLKKAVESMVRAPQIEVVGAAS